ncbi:major facilitator superfamily domain-containing protein [Rhodocollybia butyracea]|uniref:Major facilitator superfamily domain-containing protein n=1 Tax=Rhodocollybia butyracea TaxID=206335 RepID=A0A9P5U3L7_9AGAR|nr:major facilitator superfamily domain-containing protein [Rhodocollybia butyracea]
MTSTHTSSDKGDSDKGDIVMEEHAKMTTPSTEEDLPAEGTSERFHAERKLVRKLDTRVMPTIILIYIMNYIDRLAVTTARLKGLEQDLGLSDLQYNVVLSILYVSYCPAQIPSNMVLNWITRPSLYIGSNVVAWGLLSTLTGVTKSYGGILATRILIGIPECAFYPGTIYLLSRWYTKKELAFRSAILYGGLLVSNAFGSLIAAGILSNMEGTLGIHAWRWLFFIEGAITMFIGFNTMWLLPDYPVNTRWMSSQERRLAQARLADDAGEADQDTIGDSPLKGLLMAMKDPKVWVFSLMNTAQLLGLSFVNFFPTLTSTLGFNTTVSLLLVAPPWILAAIVCCVNAWHADRTGERFFHQSGWWWGVCIGFIISLATKNTAARYVSMFLMACGYVGFAMTLVWVSNVFPRPPAKRAAIIGIVNGIGNLGNLMGSYTWKAEWGPDYHQSMIISLVSLVLATVLSFVLRQWIIRDNKKLDEDEKAALTGLNHTRVEEAARLEGITLEQAMQRRRGFRYLY